MGTLEDYYTRMEQAAQRGAEQYFGQQDAPGGQSGSYVPSQNGGVSQGNRSPLDVLTGQSNVTVSPALQSSLPDAGDVAAVNAANAEYQRRVDDWNKQRESLRQQITDAGNRGDIGTAMRLSTQFVQMAPPAKPDTLAIQNQSDRARLLNEASQAYHPLISSLLSASQGNGPSAALNYYSAAADDASRRTLGAAASARGTSATRAGLYAAAMRQNAEGDLAAARQAAATGAEEQNQARANLNQSLAGLTNVYGTQLYGGTQHQQDANQQAYEDATHINAGVAQQNAQNATDFTKSALKTAGEAASAA